MTFSFYWKQPYFFLYFQLWQLVHSVYNIMDWKLALWNRGCNGVLCLLEMQTNKARLICFSSNLKFFFYCINYHTRTKKGSSYHSLFNPILNRGGQICPGHHKPVCHFRANCARVTKIHDFVPFYVRPVLEKLFFKFSNFCWKYQRLPKISKGGTLLCKN